jgi:serine protease Do
MKRNLSVALIAAIAAPVAVAAFLFGLLVAGQPSGAAYAQSPQPGTSPAAIAVPIVTPEGESPFVNVAATVIPAVVNISAETKAKQGDELFPKDFFKDWPFPFQFPAPQQPRGHTLGSGVVISSDGYIVTNNHVVDGVDEITVTLSDKTTFQGDQVKVVGADPVTDIALLKVQTDQKLPFVEWGDSDSVKVGEWAVAVGNPFGLSGTVTVGVISAKGRAGIPLSPEQRIQDFLQTDASINPGNSGGALVDIKARVIGINSAIRSPVGASVGIGFAVPSNIARQVTDELRKGGKIAHGYLGIKPQEVTESVKDAMGLENTEGVLVGEVVENAPARKAGLQNGDVITTFDGKKITDVEHFRSIVASDSPGKRVKIELVRDGKKMTVEAELAELPKEQASAAPQRETWHGLKVEALTASDKERLDVKTGVIVRSVAPGSPAENAGIQNDDVITKIVVRAKGISEEIANLDDFNQVTGKLEDYKKAIAIHIYRNKGSQIITLTPEATRREK